MTTSSDSDFYFKKKQLTEHFLNTIPDTNICALKVSWCYHDHVSAPGV